MDIYSPEMGNIFQYIRIPKIVVVEKFAWTEDKTYMYLEFHYTFLLRFDVLCPVCFFSGSGGYADNNVGAVSTTGDGESILKVTLARLILHYMEQGKSFIKLFCFVSCNHSVL